MNSRGFTIIEMAISIFLLAVAVIGIFTSFSFVGMLSAEAEDRLAATYLAQEGIEIIRNIRDTNWLQNVLKPGEVAWDDGLYACQQEMGCEVDYKTTGEDANLAYPWQDRYLKRGENDPFFNYGSGSVTKFKRKITIDASLAPYILKVKAEVFWNKKPTIINPNGAIDSFVAEETLYDWY